MSNRHDEGFGSGFGFGYDPSGLGRDRKRIAEEPFRDSSSSRGQRRYHLDDEMSGSWNGFGGRGMTDRFNERSAYEQRNVGGFYGHPYEQRNVGGFYGHPYEQRDVGGFYGHPYEQRNVGGFYGHPYEQRNVGGFYGHPYEQRNIGGSFSPYEARNVGGLYNNSYDRNLGWERSAFNTTPWERSFAFSNASNAFGMTPWERNLALFGTQNVGFNTSMTPWERNAALFGSTNGMFNGSNAFGANAFGFTTPNTFGTMPWERNAALFGGINAPTGFGMTPWERNLALLGATNTPFGTNVGWNTPSAFGMTPWERNIALFGTPNGAFNGSNLFGTPNGAFNSGSNLFGTLNGAFNGSHLGTPNGAFNNGSNLLGTLNGAFNGSSIFGTPNVFGANTFNTPNVFGANAGLFNTPNALGANTVFGTNILGANNGLLNMPNAFGANTGLFNGTNAFGNPLDRSIAERDIALFGTPFVTPLERSIAERNIALFGTPSVGNTFGSFSSPWDVRNATDYDRHPHDRGFFGQSHAGFSPREHGGFFGTERDINESNHGFGHRPSFANRGFARNEHDGVYAETNSPFWGTEGVGFGDERAPFYGRGPKGYKRPDDRIRDEIAELISRQGFIDASDVEVNVESGIVRLIGSVAQRRDKRGLEYIIERIHGVEEVRNELRLSNNSQTSDRFQNRIVDRQVSQQPPNGKNARA